MTYHVESLRAWRPEGYFAATQRAALLACPLDFDERFDGVLLHLAGRWSYEQVAEEFDALAGAQLGRFARGAGEARWEQDQQAIHALFESAGWSWDEFDDEVRRRLAAKFA